MRSSEAVYYVPSEDVDIYRLSEVARREETCLVQIGAYDGCLGLTISSGAGKSDIAQELDIDPGLLSIHYDKACGRKPLNGAVLVRV